MRDTWNMTPDEARKYILQNWFDGDENVNSFVCGDEEYTAMAIAVEALEATKWHYPSRGEYPTEGEKVLCWLWNGNYCLAYKREDDEWTTIGRFTFDGVRCWQYIEPPEE